MGVYRRTDSPMWWMSMQVDGKRVRLNTRVTDRRMAEQIFAAWQVQVARARWLGVPAPNPTHTVQELITEYLPLFDSPYFCIGGDEYVTNYDDYPQLAEYARVHFGPNATGKDTYYGFINWANTIVRDGGKTARIWNDGLKPGGATLTVDANIVVGHWSASGTGQNPWFFGQAYTAKQLIAQGHLVHNDAFTPTYFTTGGPASLFNTPPSVMYDTWDPSIFVDGTRLSDAEKPFDLGSMLHIWCDDPNALTQQQIAGEIHHRLRVMAQHTWRSPGPPFYLLFLPMISAVGDAPA